MLRSLSFCLKGPFR